MKKFGSIVPLLALAMTATHIPATSFAEEKTKLEKLHDRLGELQNSVGRKDEIASNLKLELNACRIQDDIIGAELDSIMFSHKKKIITAANGALLDLKIIEKLTRNFKELFKDLSKKSEKKLVYIKRLIKLQNKVKQLNSEIQSTSDTERVVQSRKTLDRMRNTLSVLLGKELSKDYEVLEDELAASIEDLKARFWSSLGDIESYTGNTKFIRDHIQNQITFLNSHGFFDLQKINLKNSERKPLSAINRGESLTPVFEVNLDFDYKNSGRLKFELNAIAASNNSTEPKISFNIRNTLIQNDKSNQDDLSYSINDSKYLYEYILNGNNDAIYSEYRNRVIINALKSGNKSGFKDFLKSFLSIDQYKTIIDLYEQRSRCSELVSKLAEELDSVKSSAESDELSIKNIVHEIRKEEKLIESRAGAAK